MDSSAVGSGSITAASWMKVSCGIAEGFTASCARSLRGLNQTVLNGVVLRVNGARSQRHFNVIAGHNQYAKSEYVVMEPFYFAPGGLATVADCHAALERLMHAMGGETLCSLMAYKVLALFPKAVIVKQLQTAAELCASGQSTRGLSAELNSMLLPMCERFTCELYCKAAMGFNLQSLYAMFTQHGKDAMGVMHDFTRVALEDLCLVTLDTVSDPAKYKLRKVVHPDRWEWHPLPFCTTSNRRRHRR